MVEVAEIAEDCTFLGEAFQEIVSDGGLIVLILEYDDEHVVEVFWRAGARLARDCSAQS